MSFVCNKQSEIWYTVCAQLPAGQADTEVPQSTGHRRQAVILHAIVRHETHDDIES